MKVFLCFIFIAWSSSLLNAQDLDGVWQWTSPDGSEQFEIKLERVNEKEYRGRHCAIFDDGVRIDCSENQDNFSIVMLEVTKGNFAGVIETNNKAQGKIKMQYFTKDDILHFNLTENPPGVFYLPKEAILTR